MAECNVALLYIYLPVSDSAIVKLTLRTHCQFILGLGHIVNIILFSLVPLKLQFQSISFSVQHYRTVINFSFKLLYFLSVLGHPGVRISKGRLFAEVILYINDANKEYELLKIVVDLLALSSYILSGHSSFYDFLLIF